MSKGKFNETISNIFKASLVGILAVVITFIPWCNTPSKAQGAMKFKLSDEEMARLDELSRKFR